MDKFNYMQTSVKKTKELRDKLLSDRYRPGYHFAIPEGIGMPFDPNCAFYNNGIYHLMYLYDKCSDKKFYRNSCYCLGHISSIDLLHWRHHPDALVPGDGDYGCFSGGAFVDDDGTVYLTYWALSPNKEDSTGSGVRIAKSTDYYNETWKKFDDYVVRATEHGIVDIKNENGEFMHIACADPSNIWKKDGVYYLTTGNLCVLIKYGFKNGSPKHLRGDWVDLFKSNDLHNWEYIQRFYQRDTSNKWTDDNEDNMCPSFLSLPSSKHGGNDSGKYLLLFIAHNKGCQYYIGEYDKDNEKFIPEKHGRMSWNDTTFISPEALIDDKNRQIMWAWLQDDVLSKDETFAEYGWEGVYSIPRTLWLNENGNLGIAPISEIKKLRYNEMEHKISSYNNQKIDIECATSCEINMIIKMNDAKFAGLRVLTGDDFIETTLIYYSKNSNELVLDSSNGCKLGKPLKICAPFSLNDGENLILRIFIDKAVVEVFANDRQAIARRVYTESEQSTGVYIYTDDNAVYENITSWVMFPSNPF